MTEAKSPNEYGSILVIGGGISGMTAAIEAAEMGREVFLVESEPYLGGKVSRMNLYFPKLCPPSCGLEINYRRIKQNHNIQVLTQTSVESISGSAGSYEVALKTAPLYVNEKCTSCGDCAEACDVEIPSAFNAGLSKTKAFFTPHAMTYPARYTVDKKALNDEQFAKCKAACKYDAIDDAAQEKSFSLSAGSIVVATGWTPYDASKIENLGFATYPDVISNVMMERLASTNGPTKGKLLRPSDNQPAKKVAFVQCAGSRDENHLPYCSGVCCLASLKQATYVLEQDPEAQIEIFYIDVRALGRLEDFLTRVKGEANVTLTKGKVAKIDKDGAGLVVTAEDVLGGGKVQKSFDMVVLATGMKPNGLPGKLPAGLTKDDFGFLVSNEAGAGIYSAGCAKHPVDVSTCVQDSTAAAAKAMIRSK